MQALTVTTHIVNSPPNVIHPCLCGRQSSCARDFPDSPLSSSTVTRRSGRISRGHMFKWFHSTPRFPASHGAASLGCQSAVLHPVFQCQPAFRVKIQRDVFSDKLTGHHRIAEGDAHGVHFRIVADLHNRISVNGKKHIPSRPQFPMFLPRIPGGLVWWRRFSRSHKSICRPVQTAVHPANPAYSTRIKDATGGKICFRSPGNWSLFWSCRRRRWCR